MTLNIHAGHNPAGQIACGAVGNLNESVEDRKVKDRVIAMLRSCGHTVYDCTVDNGRGQADVLQKIVAKCNAHNVDLDISIHFNAGGGRGIECWVYDTNSNRAISYANRVCANVHNELGLVNRGVKYSKDLYVLRKTRAQALLIECCFVDSTDNTLYNVDKMAHAIASAINGATIGTTAPTPQATAPRPQPTPQPTPQTNGFRVKVNCHLNVRKGAGTNYGIVTTIRDNGVYTITETCGSWGKLKSGIGWINISPEYVTRV